MPVSLNVCFFRPRKSYKSHEHTGLVTPDLSIGGSNIEFVEKWPHLGHMISLNLSDDDDVSLRRQSLIGEINTVLCRFGRLDLLLKIYFSRLTALVITVLNYGIWTV